jgi:class 3 adenylate cyclase
MVGMAAPASTRYVAVGDSDVAYQVIGEGDLDLLWFYGLGSNVELMRMTPGTDDFLARLAGFARVIVFDRRGSGASDGVPNNDLPTVEQWTEDLGAVLDAAGAERAAIVAALDAGPIAMLYAALHPERVRSLVLLNTTARYLAADDHPWGATAEEVDALVEVIGSTWGTTALSNAFSPGQAADPAFHEEAARWARLAATPRAAAAQYGYLLRHVDVREALPLIQAPTRVLHVRESPIVPLEHGRYLASQIEGARLVELPGGDLSMTPNIRAVTDELAEFLVGERPPVEIDRVLTTVVFTDIVASTERAAAMGDERWRGLLDAHDGRVRAELRRFGGREIKTTGDGFLASFDGPARAIRWGRAVIASLAELGLGVRVGVHTGECEVRDGDLSGLAVHIASRVGARAGAGEILVSRTVTDLVAGSGLEFDDRGEHELRGVPGTWPLFAVAADPRRAN